MDTSQSAGAVLMVRPTSFGYDEQTAQTNTFQHVIKGQSQKEIQQRAEAEFDVFVAKLRAHNINVVVFEDASTPSKPNAVFPNNWLSMWPDGKVYLYPMATESRRLERSPQALELLKQQFEVTSVQDMSDTESTGGVLESTGVMIFDHIHKIVYGAVSPRCDEDLFTQHAQELGYKPIVFHAYNHEGVPIYHTNVLMGVQSTTAVVCGESISDEAERKLVFDTLRNTGHEVIDVTFDQMSHFCGNAIEIQNSYGEKFLILSRAAHDAFTPVQRELLGHDKTLLPASIPTIEDVGGGSARCMVAEIFLPLRMEQVSLFGDMSSTEVASAVAV